MPPMNVYSRLFRDDAGATMVEYAVMLAFIAAICITLVLTLGEKTASNFNALYAAVNGV
jgi:Flp pilus assembly pilin Flp